MTKKNSEKTSLSISKIQRNLIRAVADYKDLPMERVNLKFAIACTQELIRNTLSPNAYNALNIPLKTAEAEYNASKSYSSGRSRHMRELNEAKQQARKEERAEEAQNPPQHRRSIYNSSPGVFGTITDEICEPSESTKRRMIGTPVNERNTRIILEARRHSL